MSPGIENELAKRERGAPEENAANMLDIAVHELFALRNHPDLENVLGHWDYAEARAREEKLEAKWAADTRYGPNMRSRVDNYIQKNETEGEQALRDMRDILQPWFEIPEDVATNYYFKKPKDWPANVVWEGDFFTRSEKDILERCFG